MDQKKKKGKSSQANSCILQANHKGEWGLMGFRLIFFLKSLVEWLIKQMAEKRQEVEEKGK